MWNMEWMNDLFTSNTSAPAYRPDSEKTQHKPSATVLQRRKDLSGVINEIAPDIVVVVEGPNRSAELQLFFDSDVAGKWKCDTQYSKGQAQNIGVATRTDLLKFNDPPYKQFDTNNPEFEKTFGEFRVDTDDDEVDEVYHFERRPLYVEINPKEGKSFRVVGLHLKSKGIFQAYEWSKWWSMADANRRKILAQASQIRLNFLDPFFTLDATKNIPLIVCGDINDGPGMDASEKRFFGSGVERLMGTIWKPNLCLGNALFDSLPLRDRERLNFEKIVTTNYDDPIFNNVSHREWIDHVLYSTNVPGAWVNAAFVESAIARKYRHASDHYPVSVLVTT
jgi:endonuclease/exonuclease/phosphatase family metal-dependent hydrolase